MSQQWRLTGLLVVSAMFAASSATAGFFDGINSGDLREPVQPTSGTVWDDDIGISTDPRSPTDEDIFDFDVSRSFPDSGYFSIGQSISINGNEIDIWALIQDHHSRPGRVFAQSLTSGGAFFDNFGPLAAGTYEVNVEIWLTPWPATSAGNLIDQETLQFTVTSAVPEPETILLLVPAIAFGFIRRRAFWWVSQLVGV